MKIKKIAAVLLAVIMMLSLGSITAFADGESDTIRLFIKNTAGWSTPISVRFSAVGEYVPMRECGEQDGVKIYYVDLPSTGAESYSVQFKYGTAQGGFGWTVANGNMYDNKSVTWSTYDAFDTITSVSGSSSRDVKAKYNESGSSDTVYSVDVGWGAMAFTYNVTNDGTWNPADHTISGTTDPTWTAEGNTVTVTNHSNAAVDVAFSYAKETGFDNVTGTFDIASDTLDAGVLNGYDSADNVTATLNLSGTLDSSYTDFTKVGTVTVTINAAA